MKTLKIVVAAALLFSSVACGANGGSESSSGKLKPDGKVGILMASAASEVVKRWGDTAAAAVEAAGLEPIQVDAENDPAKFQQAMTSMINQNVEGIITLTIDAAPITAALRQAREADIPVVAAGLDIDPAGADLFSGVFAPDDERLGLLAADYLAEKVPPGASYVQLDLSAVYGAHAPIVAATPVLKEAGFKLDGTHDINTADLINSAQQGAVDLMNANPDADFMFSCCDFTTAITAPALRRAGFENVIQTSRYDNLSTLKQIRGGAPVATAATDADRSVLIALDQIFAYAANGTEIDRDADADVYSYKMIDSTNLPDEGDFVYDPQPIIDEYVAKWTEEFDL